MAHSVSQRRDRSQIKKKGKENRFFKAVVNDSDNLLRTLSPQCTAGWHSLLQGSQQGAYLDHPSITTYPWNTLLFISCDFTTQLKRQNNPFFIKLTFLNHFNSSVEKWFKCCWKAKRTNMGWSIIFSWIKTCCDFG